MSTRGSALSRALKYFRECDVDEARVAATIVKEIVDRRLSQSLGGGQAATPKIKRARTPRTQSPVAASKENESLASA